RRMFETGIQLRRERGAENVFDFSIGNPDLEPPEAVVAALRRVVAQNRPRSHGYMPNAGYPEVRESIARRLSARSGVPYSAADILMTTGAAGAINTLLKAILDPGDEVLVLSPYFPEYRFYIENHAGRMVLVETDEQFQPVPARIAAAVTPRTRALILNSPNNPTGAVYSAAALRGLNAALPGDVMVICDEPYRPIVFDGVRVPEAIPIFRRAAIAWSWSKAQGLSGERIGYLALPPGLPGIARLREACTIANRILGYINAPAIWQWVVGAEPDATIDVSEYQARRDLLCDALAAAGYDVARPQGSFYVFPKTPIPDDVAFIRMLQEEGILAVPGAGFGRGGYMRLSLTIPREAIERSLPGFARARERACAPILVA
ncbi:MAG TPA: pyridoxal phosphate-dependent aminotransferase, partial [Candidatus Acidoferrales bacterium]|nr:pyridoxal phosphate-dependent aminotransferase [Candidatus Acidoferrales bacterium]